ncbi:MAG: hypothetical protein P4M11_04860 [Candidatus Pacebacteria bacterium]|nr:hypothetical protein [Candidatus Paceibacterota bacterium]
MDGGAEDGAARQEAAEQECQVARRHAHRQVYPPKLVCGVDSKADKKKINEKELSELESGMAKLKVA